jgi:hypothetical protein
METYTAEQIRYLAADLGLDPEQVLNQVHAYGVGSFQVGDRSHIHVKRQIDRYRVRLSVRARPEFLTNWRPPHGPFTVTGEAQLREEFPGMDRETSQRLVSEADDGYAPGSPDTLAGSLPRRETCSPGRSRPAPRTRSPARMTAPTW